MYTPLWNIVASTVREGFINYHTREVTLKLKKKLNVCDTKQGVKLSSCMLIIAAVRH